MMPPPPQALPLFAQLDYTDGLCAPFAVAASRLLGTTLAVLHCADPRQFRAHDWPEDVPLQLHVFTVDADGAAIDAEGRRPMDDLLRSFGVRRGYKFRLETPVPETDLASMFSSAGDEKLIDEARLFMVAHGWRRGHVPPATGDLARNWALARAQQRERLQGGPGNSADAAGDVLMGFDR